MLLSLEFASAQRARAFREALRPMWEVSGAQRAWVLPGSDTESRCFLYKLVPPRPTFPMDMTPVEQEVMGHHVGYWQGLTGEGTAVVFGAVADPAGAFGLAVVKAASREEVEAIGGRDAAVTSGVATFHVYDMPDAITRALNTKAGWVRRPARLPEGRDAWPPWASSACSRTWWHNGPERSPSVGLWAPRPAVSSALSSARGLRLVAVGLVPGFAGATAAAAARLLARLLYEIGSWESPLISVRWGCARRRGLLATLIPVIKAGAIAPLTALSKSGRISA